MTLSVFTVEREDLLRVSLEKIHERRQGLSRRKSSGILLVAMVTLVVFFLLA